MCWGDVGLLLTMPRQGLGNSAIAAVADDEQKERFAGKWAAMAITEPEAGSDSAAIRTTADPRRRRVRAQRREDLRHLRRARRAGRRLGLARPRAGPRRDQVVRRRALQPGAEARPARAQARDPRLRHRRLHPRRLPRAEGGPARQPRDRHEEGLRRRRCRRSTTRARWSPAMAVGVARACLERTRELLAEAGVEIDYDRPAHSPERRRGRAASSSRPTTRPPAC